MTGPYKFVIILYIVFLSSIILSNGLALGVLTSLRRARKQARKKILAKEAS